MPDSGARGVAQTVFQPHMGWLSVTVVLIHLDIWGRRMAMRLGAVVTLLLAMPAMAFAADAPPHFAKGTPYKTVRSQLIALGYSPVPQKPDPDNLFCGAFDGEADICKVYPEVSDCGGTGIRPCWFVFQRKTDGKRLAVTTYGEQTSRLMLLKTEWKAAR